MLSLSKSFSQSYRSILPTSLTQLARRLRLLIRCSRCGSGTERPPPRACSHAEPAAPDRNATAGSPRNASPAHRILATGDTLCPGRQSPHATHASPPRRAAPECSQALTPGSRTVPGNPSNRRWASAPSLLLAPRSAHRAAARTAARTLRRCAVAPLHYQIGGASAAGSCMVNFQVRRIRQVSRNTLITGCRLS